MLAVSYRIRQFRTQKGWSVHELGAKVGLTGTSIARIEKGTQNVTMENFSKIAFALGVRIADLFDEDDRVAYAFVRGAIGEDAGGLFSGDNTYAIPFPLSPLQRPKTRSPIVGRYDAFADGSGFLAGYLTSSYVRDNLGFPFVVLLQHQKKQWLEARQFEDSSTGPGFQAQTGDPAWRWIRFEDKRVVKSWLILAEVRYFGQRPDLAPMPFLWSKPDLE